jgi:heptosyltransferase-2
MWPSDRELPRKILIIQTAFIGDVILATALVENLAAILPDAQMLLLVRKGNESLLSNNPHIKRVLVWDKKNQKIKNLGNIIREVRRQKFDLVINLHRFASSGIISILSGAKQVWGYDKNPLSYLFSKTFPHLISGKGQPDYLHEVDRNNQFVQALAAGVPLTRRPALFPSQQDYDFVNSYKAYPYITISPSSVWFTKQFPPEKWVEVITNIDPAVHIYLLGGKDDAALAQTIIESSERQNIYSLAGKLSFLQSAALMRDAVRNFTNDSAPLHISSAMNVPTTAVFCSTIPEFGFGPLSDNSEVWQVSDLYCRPCGLHGYRVCPEGHFHCALKIAVPSNPL